MSSKRRPSPSTIYMLFSVLSITLSNFFAKISLDGLSVYATVLIRFSIPFLILVFIVIIFQTPVQLQFSCIKLNIIRAISLTFSQILLFISMRKLPLSEAVILYNMGPIIITLFSIFLGYKAKQKEWFGLTFGTVGLLIICHVQNGIFSHYILYGFLSGVCFSISQMSLYASIKKQSNFSIMLSLYFFTTLISSVLYLFFDKIPMDIGVFKYPLVVILFLVGSCSLLNQYFRGKAYKEAPSPSSLAPLIYFSVIFSGILDFLFFRLLPDTQSIIGCLLIFTGSYITFSAFSDNQSNIDNEKN